MVRQFDPESVRELIAEISSITDEMIAETRELNDERERDKEAHAKEDEERESAARRGAFGPEWQKLQQRMDRGETSWSAIFNGLDEDPSTVSVVEKSFDRLDAMISEAHEAVEDEDSPAHEAFNEMTKLDEEIQAKLAAIEAELDHMRRTS